MVISTSKYVTKSTTFDYFFFQKIKPLQANERKKMKYYAKIPKLQKGKESPPKDEANGEVQENHINL